MSVPQAQAADEANPLVLDMAYIQWAIWHHTFPAGDPPTRERFDALMAKRPYEIGLAKPVDDAALEGAQQVYEYVRANFNRFKSEFNNP